MRLSCKLFFCDHSPLSRTTTTGNALCAIFFSLSDLYLNYLRTPFVISIKDRLSQVVHLGLHFRLCVLASSVSVRTEEWLTLIFYIGFMLSEYQQYRSSKSAKEKRVRVYLRLVRRPGQSFRRSVSVGPISNYICY